MDYLWALTMAALCEACEAPTSVAPMILFPPLLLQASSEVHTLARGFLPGGVGLLTGDDVTASFSFAVGVVVFFGPRFNRTSAGLLPVAQCAKTYMGESQSSPEKIDLGQLKLLRLLNLYKLQYHFK